MQSTFTFKQRTIARFWQARFRLRSVPESDILGWNLATSDRCHRIPGIPCQIPARLAGAVESLAIWPGSWTDSAVLAGSPAIWPDPRLDPAIWPDPRHLAESVRSSRISGQLAENWPRRPFCARFWSRSQESGKMVRYCRNLYLANIKKYFYIILY
jgi:hypothetical protein